MKQGPLVLAGALFVGLVGLGTAAPKLGAQTKLSPHWEDLTGPDFIQAIHEAQGVCLLPFGIIEKHGAHLPLGNDLINVRYITDKAAGENYVVIFPPYYFGQIAEAKHQPGTVSYSMHLQLDLIQETVDEMSRNGCKKIVIVNGHGGNEHLLPFFAQQQLQSPHDYVVYVYWWPGAEGRQGRPFKPTPTDMHGGETETSHTIVAAPGLVHMDRAGQESLDQKRLHLPEGVYTGIWWYASFPNHYSGVAADASRALGEFDAAAETKDIANVIAEVKADTETPRLQKEFFERSSHPLDTPQ